MSHLTLEAKLERIDPNTPWGFRMQGGKDFCCPLTIQRVNPGSLAAKCGLQTGDIILKIGNADTHHLRHKEAQNNIITAGNKLDLLLQRGGAPFSIGGGGSYDTFASPATGGYSPSQSFNASPKPQFSPQQSSSASINLSIDAGLSQRTQNVSLSPGASCDASPTPGVVNTISAHPTQGNDPSDFRAAAEKYAQREEPLKPSQHQSRSFKLAQNFADDENESPESHKCVKPSSLLARRISSREDKTGSAVPVAPMQVIGQGKPGSVKAIISQRYNNPIGLYSKEEALSQFQNQAKVLISPNETGSGAPPAPLFVPKPAAPAPSFQPKPAAPATSFQPKPAPSAPASKPWTPAPAAPAGGSRPFGGGAPPRPTGSGARRGLVGEAKTRPASTDRIPICASCAAPIRGPFVTALGNCWCPDHFVCANPQCGVKLLDIGFVEDGGHLYCERDYEKYMAPHCKKCSVAIVGECVNALQTTWHPNCFLCTQCKQPIGGNQFHIEDGKPFCEKDWAAMFQTMCTGCDFPIEPGDRWVEAMSKNFHAECFNCSTCQVSLEGQPFVAKAGKAFCKKHAR